MKILHLPTDVGNHGMILSQCERDLGHHSLSVAILPKNYLGYIPDRRFIFSSKLRNIIKSDLLIRPYILALAQQFDIIHYNFGRSISPAPPIVGSIYHNRWKLAAYLLYCNFLPMLDVKYLKKIGKKIIVTFQGGDARQGSILKFLYPEWSDADEEPPGYYSERLDRIKAKRISLWDKLADKIYFYNPDLGHVLPSRAKFLPYAIIDPKKIKSIWNPGRRIIFGHIVNHREPKGTRFILDAINELRYLDYGFILAERVNRDIALRLYGEITVLLEQFVIGWYGGQAVECMAMGIPIVVWIRKEDLKFVPEEMVKDFPFIIASKEDLRETIKSIISDPEVLKSYSEKGRAFVMKYHDPHKIAAHIISQFEGG